MPVKAILIKVMIILFLIVILYSLGSGLYYLVRDKKKDEVKVVKALTWRIGLSVTLFILLLISFAMGWISPHAI